MRRVIDRSFPAKNIGCRPGDAIRTGSWDAFRDSEFLFTTQTVCVSRELDVSRRSAAVMDLRSFRTATSPPAPSYSGPVGRASKPTCSRSVICSTRRPTTRGSTGSPRGRRTHRESTSYPRRLNNNHFGTTSRAGLRSAPELTRRLREMQGHLPVLKVPLICVYLARPEGFEPPTF